MYAQLKGAWPGGYAYFLRYACMLKGWDECAALFPPPTAVRSASTREGARATLCKELRWKDFDSTHPPPLAIQGQGSLVPRTTPFGDELVDLADEDEDEDKESESDDKTHIEGEDMGAVFMDEVEDDDGVKEDDQSRSDARSKAMQQRPCTSLGVKRARRE